MQGRKVIFIILILIMLIFTAYKIATTYAVFYSEMSGTASKDLAKWNITVNGDDITAGITKTFTVNKFNAESNTNVKEGKFAPGIKGNFTLSINPVDTQVSVRYDISIDTTYITNNKITLESASEITSANTIIRTAENTYTGIIPLSKINGSYTNDIKVSFIWENDETNNEADTAIGTSTDALKIQIPITVNVKQYLGEEIIPYI